MGKTVKKLLQKNGVGSSELELWLGAFENLSRPEQKKLEDILTSYPKLIKQLTENLKKKVEIMEQGTYEDWSKLLEEEKTYIQKL